MDLALHRQRIAHALVGVESSISRLIDALAHRPCWVSVEGTASDPLALKQICDAYSGIDYDMEDAVGSSVVCLGVAGVSAEVLKRAIAVNAAKAAFREVCVPLQAIRTRVPMKGGSSPTKAIPVIRAVLRNIQRSDVNLLAAYRKIPILNAPPVSVTYTRARTRAVYRKSVEDLYTLLLTVEGPAAASDRARLASLKREEKFLALTRPHYDNIRANIVYSRLDARGRGRVQMAAELPLIYAMGRHPAPPEIRYPDPVDENAERTVRKAALEPEPFLHSIPAYRYRSKPAK
jgi:hypothetical protein